MSPVDLLCWVLVCSRAAHCCLSSVECVFVCWMIQVSPVDLLCWPLVCSRAAHCCLSTVECVCVCLLQDPSVVCGPVVLASCL